MRKKFILTNTIIVSLSLILMMIISIILVSNQNINNASDQAKKYLDLATEFYNGSNEQELIKKFKNTDNDLRITIIDESGVVIADSNISSIEESHIDRLEIKNIGKVYKRYSNTLDCDMLYIAAVDEGYYVRIALPIESINRLTSAYITIGLLILVSILAVTVILILTLSEKTIKQINAQINSLSKLADKSDFSNVSIDDLPLIIEGINHSLDDKLKKISNQKEQINDVLNTLSSGVLVINDKGIIKIINKSALKIFKMSYDNVINKEYIYLTRDIGLQNIITDSLNDKTNNEGLIHIDDKYYKIIITYKDSSWINNGLIIVVRNITESILLDKTKREFFANASHELKSPLTCIIGYQQMITEGIEMDINNIIDYSNMTLKEARRMNDIVVDMLNLSRLEREEAISNEEVYCKPIVLDIVESLNQKLKSNNITVNLNLNDVTLTIDKGLVYNMFRNLIDNAIKYNKQNGYINITLTNESFIVEDGGIGIPISDQPHVFERFYRVDKAKSKSLGGTGLGLAIVKHICEIYKYKIFLKSNVGTGTKIEIKFNN